MMMHCTSILTLVLMVIQVLTQILTLLTSLSTIKRSCYSDTKEGDSKRT